MPSNHPWVCVPCRYVARQLDKCPHCGAAMVERHYSWRAPRRNHDAAWKRIAAGDWLWDKTVSRTAMDQTKGPFRERVPNPLWAWFRGPHQKLRQGGRIRSTRVG